MKKNSLMTLVLCLASAAGMGSAAAQSGSQVRLTLPYAVTVGSVTLPAGDCTITDWKHNGHESFFLIRSEAGPAADVTMESSGAPWNSNETTSVQLRRVGDKYEIQGMRIGGQEYRVN